MRTLDQNLHSTFSRKISFKLNKEQYFEKMSSTISQGDNAWVMTASCLVMFMTPGVGFFYGGMVNKKNLLSTIAYCFLVFCIATITWALLGFSLAFSTQSGATGFIGDCTYCGLRNISLTVDTPYAPTLPLSTFFLFQTMFAAITPAIFIGSVIGRIRVSFLIVLTVGFNIIVYAPITFWMWNHDGWLYKMGAIDFAGGNVIHVCAGFAGLASAVYLGHGQKKSYKQKSSSISLTLVGTAILWVGWFGFNGGSALASGQLASNAILNSHLSACAAGLAWSAIQYMITSQLSILGWCCGAICGLVSMTPGAGFVSLWSSLIIGAFGGMFSYLFCHFKTRYFNQLADTLDVFGCHGISGIWGCIATGLFASLDSSNTETGLFYGNGRQLGVNLLSVVACASYSFFVTWLLYFLLGKIMNAKVSGSQEEEGLDFAVHGQQNDPLSDKDVQTIIKSLKKLSPASTKILTQMEVPEGNNSISLKILQLEKPIGSQCEPHMMNSAHHL